MTDEGYFDTAASVPPYPEALRRFEEASLRQYGNPSSSHEAGLQARTTLQNCRNACLHRLGFADGTLVLTSGATEANNLVLQGGRPLIAADVHPSVWFARERSDEGETGPHARIFPAQ